MLPRLIVALLVPALACGAAEALEIRTFTASELGFLASSHLVLGAEEAMLVDAQFTRSDARQVADLVRSTERRLTAIFITHGRPEHFLGLEVLAESFPEARILARPATVEAIRANGEDAIERWQPIYLDDLPSRVVVPEPFAGEALTLEGVEIRILDLAGDSEGLHPTPLHVPAEKTLFASDLALGGVHLWLVGVDLGTWSESLAALGKLDAVTWVYPGHGAGGGSDLLAESARYLAALQTALALNSEPSQVTRAMEQSFPGYQLPVLLERSVRASRERR